MAFVEIFGVIFLFVLTTIKNRLTKKGGKVKWQVDITSTPASPAASATADYVQLADSFPATGVVLAADVVPYSLENRTVAWSINGPSVEGTENAGMFYTGRITGGTGISTVTATPAAGGVNGTYVFNLLGELVNPTSVTINGTVPTNINPGDIYLFAAPTVGPPGALQDVVWSVTPATAAAIYPNGLLRPFNVTEDTEITVTATAKDFPAVIATKTINVRKTSIARWLFGPYSIPAGTGATAGDGWQDLAGSNPNTVPVSIAPPNGIEGLTLNAPVPVRWDSVSTGFSRLNGAAAAITPAPYNGTVQFSAAGASTVGEGSWGEIDPTKFGLTLNDEYKLSIVYTNTGDNRNSNRFLWIKFGDDAAVANTVNMFEKNGVSATSIDEATFTRVGQGKATFGCADNGLCIWEIRVEDANAAPPPINLHWGFDDPPAVITSATGWTGNNADVAAPNGTNNIVYRDGMTVLANDTVAIRWLNASNHSGSPKIQALGGTGGAISRNNGSVDYITVSGIPANRPVTIKVIFASNGNSGYNNRGLKATIGEDSFTTSGYVHGAANDFEDDANTTTYTIDGVEVKDTSLLYWEYDGPGGTLTLTPNGGTIRIQDVWITAP